MSDPLERAVAAKGAADLAASAALRAQREFRESVRDALETHTIRQVAVALGLSHARVHQIAHKEER